VYHAAVKGNYLRPVEDVDDDEEMEKKKEREGIMGGWETLEDDHVD